MAQFTFGTWYQGFTEEDYNSFRSNTAIMEILNQFGGVLEYSCDGGICYIVPGAGDGEALRNALFESDEGLEASELLNTFVYCGSAYGFSTFLG